MISWIPLGYFVVASMMGTVPDECPSDEQVASELQALFAHRPKHGLPPDVQVEDLGSSFVVEVADQRKVVEDRLRACHERARIAAVFLALHLRPPQVLRPLQAVPPPPRPLVVAREKSSWGPLSVELGGLAESAFGGQGETSDWSTGALMRGSRAFGPWGFSAAAGFGSPVRRQLGGVRARMARSFGELALSSEAARGPALAGIRAGVRVTRLSLLGEEGLADSARAVRVDVAPVASAYLRLASSVRVTPFLQISGAYSPRLYRLGVSTGETLGTTPRLWLGAAAGASVTLD